MDCQDWTPVVARRHYSKKEAHAKGQTTIQVRDAGHSERIRLAKLDSTDAPIVKKRVQPESLQSLIRKRIEMKLTQEKADQLCSFPANTFKNIESNRLVPAEDFKQRIHQQFGVQLKVDNV